MGQVVENERRQQLIDLAWFGVGHEPQWLLLKRALEDDAVEIAAVSEVLNAVGGEIGDLVLIVIEVELDRDDLDVGVEQVELPPHLFPVLGEAREYFERGAGGDSVRSASGRCAGSARPRTGTGDQSAETFQKMRLSKCRNGSPWLVKKSCASWAASQS